MKLCDAENEIVQDGSDAENVIIQDGSSDAEIELDSKPESLTGFPLDASHAYEWEYQVIGASMFHLPLIIIKTFWIAAVFIWLLFFLILFLAGNYEWKFIKDFSVILLITVAGSSVLVVFVFTILLLVYKGRWVFRLKIDPEAVYLVQTAKEKKRDDIIGTIAVLSSLFTNSYAANSMGNSMLSGDINRILYSEIMRIRLYRKWNLINITRLFGCFQVYVSKEDFDHVRDYIVTHLPEKKRQKYRSKWKIGQC